MCRVAMMENKSAYIVSTALRLVLLSSKMVKQ